MVKRPSSSGGRRHPRRQVAAKPHARRATANEGKTEQRILEAASRVFVRRGTAGARMEEIAREARVNQALLHYYFRSKERLAAAAFEMIAGRIFQRPLDSLASDLSLEQKSRDLITLYLEAFSRNPSLPGYLLSELHHHPERAARLLGRAGAPPKHFAPPFIETLRRQIDEAVATGEMHEISPQQFIINLLSLCMFPFAARALLSQIVGVDGPAFNRFIESEKRDLPDFFQRAVRP